MTFRRTKIVATIGPASQSDEMLNNLIKAGINVARLNFSHGTHESHAKLYASLRSLSTQNNVFLTILQDLCGPKIRLGEVEPGTVMKAGEEWIFTSQEVMGKGGLLYVSYSRLAQEVEPGNMILLDDGALQCQVERTEGDKVYARVMVGGPVSSHKGVNLPGAKLSIPALTPKDADDLRFGLKMGVDYVAMSFVRSPQDIIPAHQIMEELGIYRPIIAKIEKPEALECIEDIIEAFDGIMVARGDLGVEMPIEEVPLVQKRLIHLARKHYKPVICATQMLDSMIRNPRPTRAEVTDIANAIFDGADAVMLSGETASGNYPREAVEVMACAAAKAEAALPYESIFTLDMDKKDHANLGREIALSACEIAEASEAEAIVVCTNTGRTARNVSHFRPRNLVVGVAQNLEMARQLHLLFGVEPAYIDKKETLHELIRAALVEAKQRKYIKSGDKAVVVAGFPPGADTNLVFAAVVP